MFYMNSLATNPMMITEQGKESDYLEEALQQMTSLKEYYEDHYGKIFKKYSTEEKKISGYESKCMENEKLWKTLKECRFQLSQYEQETVSLRTQVKELEQEKEYHRRRQLTWQEEAQKQHLECKKYTSERKTVQHMEDELLDLKEKYRLKAKNYRDLYDGYRKQAEEKEKYKEIIAQNYEEAIEYAKLKKQYNETKKEKEEILTTLHDVRQKYNSVYQQHQYCDVIKKTRKVKERKEHELSQGEDVRIAKNMDEEDRENGYISNFADEYVKQLQKIEKEEAIDARKIEEDREKKENEQEEGMTDEDESTDNSSNEEEMTSEMKKIWVEIKKHDWEQKIETSTTLHRRLPVLVASKEKVSRRKRRSRKVATEKGWIKQCLRPAAMIVGGVVVGTMVQQHA